MQDAFPLGKSAGDAPVDSESFVPDSGIEMLNTTSDARKFHDQLQ